MPYLTVNNFKFGLDARRSELSAIPGTLIQAVDGHITQGAEFEKRKAFVQLNGTSRPANTYGLEVTSTGLVVFGSFAPTSGNGIGSAVAGTTLYNFTSYAGVYYQQLIHPSSLFGNGSPPAMTALLCSTSFGGDTWAAATFADGDTYLYYNGTPVPGSYNGTVLTGANTITDIATQLATFIATIPGFSVSGITTSGGLAYFNMWSSSGLSYSLVTGLTSTNTGSGTLASPVLNTFVPGTAAVSSTASFTIEAGNYSQTNGYFPVVYAGITSIKVRISGTLTEVLGATVTMGASDTVASFATNVAAQIDTYNSGTGITAVTTGGTVTLSFPSTSGSTPNGDDLEVITQGNLCVDNTIFNFSANATLPGSSTCTSVQLPNTTNEVGSVSYNGSGTYSQAVTAGLNYYWKPGANDVSYTNGGGPVTTAGYFTAAGSSVTLTGTASATVTASVIAYTELLASTVNLSTNTVTALLQIAQAIRANCQTSSLPFTAFANGSYLNVSRQLALTSNPFGGEALITVSGGITVTDGANAPTTASMRAVAMPSSLSMARPKLYNNKFNNAATTGTVAIAVTGGVAPYTFAWTPVAPVTGAGIFILINPPPTYSQNQVATFQAVFSHNANGSISQIYNCSVTDSTNTTVNVLVNVSASAANSLP